MKRYCRLTLAVGAVALGGIACGEGSTPVVGSDGPAVSIVVAPLDQSGVGVACFDLKVTTELGTLWEKGNPALNFNENDEDTICSDDHGNAGGGSIRWVGSCDAQAAADTDEKEGVQNTVTLWFDGIYTDSTKTTETAGVYDPCGAAGCSLQFDCIANTDTLAEFNFTVIRDAQNGFFDIAVRFDNIYCASKYDDCNSNNEDITLFSDNDGDHKTGVYALACTAPLGKDVDLHYGNLAVVCGDVVFPINPNVSARTDAVSVPPGNSLTYDVYRDQTTVNCDDDTVVPPVTGNCNGLFWNISFDLKDLESLGTCTLAFSATATNGTGSFVDGLPTNPGSTYPYIDVDATISGGETACQQNPLNGDGSAVVANYHGDFGLAAVAMCYTYDGTTTTTTGNASCTDLPQAAPLGNVLRAYSAPCNPDAALYPVDSFNPHPNPIECGSGEICIPGGSYNYGQCVPSSPALRLCTYQGGCTESTVELTFSRASTESAWTLPVGTFVSTATDPDGDPATGWQYNYQLTEEVVLLQGATQVVATAILYTQDLAPDDRPNVAANTLTVIGQSGTPGDWGDITVTNAAATGANPNLRCQTSGSAGYCVEKGTPQACDYQSLEPHCPAGSYCEPTGDGGMCRQKGGEGVRCSTSYANNGVEMCQSGLNCMSDPSNPQDSGGYCRVPGDEGAPCQLNGYGGIQCKADLYCRYESQTYATCSPRKAVGDFCSTGNQNLGPESYYVGNCGQGLFCGLTYSNPQDMNERKCAVNALLDDGEACWLSGEQSLRKCKGHCDVDVNNPFENINADGVCRPDFGEGEVCHVSSQSVDYGGYCRRGLYCNDGAGQYQMSMISGTCLPIDEIGGACQRDAMCPSGQVCGNQYLLSEHQSHCVDRGCGNRVVEEGGMFIAGDIGLLERWPGQCASTNAGCNSDLDCIGPDTCTLGEYQVFTPTPGFIALGVNSFQVGDPVKVQFYPPEGGPWEARTVTSVVNPWTLTISGGTPPGYQEVRVAGMDYEECDDGMFNCDTVINGEHVCSCSTLCMMQQ